jgi:hypothetical protein
MGSYPRQRVAFADSLATIRRSDQTAPLPKSTMTSQSFPFEDTKQRWDR